MCLTSFFLLSNFYVRGILFKRFTNSGIEPVTLCLPGRSDNIKLPGRKFPKSLLGEQNFK